MIESALVNNDFTLAWPVTLKRTYHDSFASVFLILSMSIINKPYGEITLKLSFDKVKKKTCWYLLKFPHHIIHFCILLCSPCFSR
jgi:hypothetical protein